MEALIAYSGRSLARPRYYANAHDKDAVEIAPVAMPIRDARGRVAVGPGHIHAAQAHRMDRAPGKDARAIHRLCHQDQPSCASRSAASSPITR
jgi:hypothetical protein